MLSVLWFLVNIRAYYNSNDNEAQVRDITVHTLQCDNEGLVTKINAACEGLHGRVS